MAYFQSGLNLLGQNESADNSSLRGYLGFNPATTPWCAGFVSSTLQQGGYPTTGAPLSAQSYLNYGQAVQQGNVQVGDIAVFTPANTGISHIGIVSGFDAQGNPLVLQGNANDSVRIDAEDASKLVFRRPVDSNGNTPADNGDNTGSSLQSGDKTGGRNGSGYGDPSTRSDHTKTAGAGSPLSPKSYSDIKGSAGNYQKTTTKSITSRLPTHEPWDGHPKSMEGPRQAIQGDTGSSGSGGSGGGSGGGGGSTGSSANPSGGTATTNANATGSQTKSITPEGRALLDTIAEAEGTYGKGNDGYNINFGGKTFDGDQFPNRPRQFAVNGSTTSAAGRYQFEAGTWASYQKQLGLPDFSPESQDKAAWADAQAVYRRKGGGDLQSALENGTFQPSLLGSEWASFPGTTGQTRRSSDQIQANYQKFLAKQKAKKPPTADPGSSPNANESAPTPAASSAPGTAAVTAPSGSSTTPRDATQTPTS